MTMQSLYISYIIVMEHTKQYPFQAEVGVQLLLPLEQYINTVEPPYNGQLGTNAQCPLFGGVRCTEVSCFAHFDAICMFCSLKTIT